MEHRHLNHRAYTLAAIDSIIDRGQPFPDWRDLCRKAIGDPAVLARVERVSNWRAAGSDEDFSRELYGRWKRWCEKRRNMDRAACGQLLQAARPNAEQR